MREQNIQKRKEGIDPLELYKLVSNTRKKKEVIVMSSNTKQEQELHLQAGLRRRSQKTCWLFERKRESGTKAHL